MLCIDSLSCLAQSSKHFFKKFVKKKVCIYTDMQDLEERLAHIGDTEIGDTET